MYSNWWLHIISTNNGATEFGSADDTSFRNAVPKLHYGIFVCVAQQLQLGIGCLIGDVTSSHKISHTPSRTPLDE
jgi:hypothetical protein